jgi:aspartyl-tRNA(Asn)/glutamyl-tRNA(Gln) amidotransferase subunit A
VADSAALSVAEAAAALSSGRLAIADLLHACQKNISQFNGSYRAFSRIAVPSASQIAVLQAELAEGKPRSVLHGLTVSIKGNIPVQGLPWTEGSAVFAGRIATTDAAIVAHARAAGAIILGITTLSELAMYGVRNAFEPMGINPWCPKRTAGGSSIGAGVAACLAMAAVNIGTDSGGSIRNPACHLGVVGFMPSVGSLPSIGVPDHVPSFPALGLICRSVTDVTIAFEILAARKVVGCSSGRLIVPARLIEKMCDRDTATLFADALRRLQETGFKVIDYDMLSWRPGEAAAGVISLFESARTLSQMNCANTSDGIRQRRDIGLALSKEEVDSARHCAASFSEQLRDALDTTGADAVVSPTWPFAAPMIDAQTVVVHGRTISIDPHRNCFVRAANSAGAAALTLPMGLYPEEQVPAGLHLMSDRRREDRLLSAAARIEAVMPRLPLPPPLRDRASFSGLVAVEYSTSKQFLTAQA